MAPLSPSQEKALSILPAFSGCLSILGSSTFLLMLSRKHAPAGTPKRILAAMCSFDIVHTTTLIMTPFLQPTESGRAWAFGNAVTCSVMGFFGQLGMAVFLYNCNLNLYYCLCVVAGRSEEAISRHWEIWMHLIALGYPLVTAIAGVVLGIYGETVLGFNCWIAAGVETTLTAIFGAPLFFSYVFLLVSNVAIYFKVWWTTRRSRASVLSGPSQQYVKDVAVQATFYVGAAFSVGLPMSIIRLYEVAGYTRQDEQDLLWSLVFVQLLFPLQGFWNFAIYIRPRYMQRRRRCATESRFWCFRHAILNSADNIQAHGSACGRHQKSDGTLATDVESTSKQWPTYSESIAVPSSV